ncbi:MULTISPECIES: hypothetical protein [unclassified Bifidobacterium]|uniref:hypothetical protein n=1 Tax=unclassified Bifidobacterium TaxID=2608897 RepID=UPI0023FA09FC|nr:MULTISPECIES: hypothetical protein [unclassified Bifidobacterium]WEV65758.1 hypothetical protein OZX71_08455 [Bifidobacterium sp. ESL0764]WEV75455.1 hypothetical protein OZX75_07495 [Bifidobacterium sp. ESL0800]
MASHHNKKPGNAGLCWLAGVVLLAIAPKVSPPLAAAILAVCVLYAIRRIE